MDLHMKGNMKEWEEAPEEKKQKGQKQSTGKEIIEKLEENVKKQEQNIEKQEKNIEKQEKNIKQQEENIKQQEKNIKKQEDIKKQKTNIDKQKKNTEQVLKENMKKLEECIVLISLIEVKGCITILGGAIAVAAVLIILSVSAQKSTPCEREEALNLLNLSYPLPCNHYDVKEKIGNIIDTEIASLVLDVLAFFVALGSILMCVYCPTSVCRKIGLILFYTFLAVESFGISVTLLVRYSGISEFKSTQKNTDHAEIKTIMLSNLTNFYLSDDNIDITTMTGRWNTFFIKYDCCAVNQVMGTTNDFDTTPWCTTSGSCQQTNSQIPKPCCKSVSLDDYQTAQDTCHANVECGTYKESCYTRFKSLSDVSIDGNDIQMLCFGMLILAALKFSLFALAIEEIVLICTWFAKSRNGQTGDSSSDS